MNERYDAQTLELIAKTVTWILRDSLRWRADETTLNVNEYGRIVWLVNPAKGGPVRIVHQCPKFGEVDIALVVDISERLAETAQDVEAASPERNDYERQAAKAAKSLLRRKSASGVRLVGVVSEPVETDRGGDIGVEVTFEIEHSGDTVLRTLEIFDVEELADAFEAMLKEI